MSTNGNIPILEEMIIGTAEELDHSRTYSIFLRGEEGERSIHPDSLIELLLLCDSGVFDVDTLADLFDVSVHDIVLFTEKYPGYWGVWTESVATMWTHSLQFYEDDMDDLAWIARYAIKRAEMAVAMEKTLLEATIEMSEELADDEGWTEDTLFMRKEGQEEQNKRSMIMSGWFCRSELGGEDAEYETT